MLTSQRAGVVEGALRRTAWALGLGAVLVAGFVVMTLPGATNASSAPAFRRQAEAATLNPILLGVDMEHLVLPADPIAVSPDPPSSYFQNAQIVALYGYPGVCSMGELGCHDAEQAAALAEELAARYDDANGSRRALPALHLIAAVAHPVPGPDGTYLGRTPLEVIRQYVEVARAHHLLLFLDVQVGWADPLAEVQRLQPVLIEPFVHVALDPEFATRTLGRPPGQVIGTLDAAQVNPVLAYLAGLVQLYRLPPKIVVLHQFQPGMLTNKAAYEPHPQVEVTIDMDGFGSPGAKLSGYDAYARVDAQYSAFKLFYHWDEPLLTPQELLALPHPPDYVIYQ